MNMSVYFCPARAGQVKSRLRLSGGLPAFGPRAGWNEGLFRAADTVEADTVERVRLLPRRMG